MANSAFDAEVGSGTSPAFSNSTPLCSSSVASPPSSRIMFGPSSPSAAATSSSARCTTSTPRASRPSRRTPGRPAGPRRCRSAPTATAAAAWSCVEKMLQLAQRTSAPSSTSVSMSTAVWMVMCSDPEMRAPASGLDGPNSLRSARRPGISCSARWISLRPNGASERSATRKSRRGGRGWWTWWFLPGCRGQVVEPGRCPLALVAAHPARAGSVMSARTARHVTARRAERSTARTTADSVEQVVRRSRRSCTPAAWWPAP